MCFPNGSQKSDPTPLFDEDGAIIEEQNSDVHVPEGIHEHVDSVYLNFDFEDGILAYVYETSDRVIIVWTSPEAEQFGQVCEALNYPIL